jgi:hypothetical protein
MPLTKIIYRNNSICRLLVYEEVQSVQEVLKASTSSACALYEGVWGSRGYRSACSSSWHYTELNCQLYDVVARPKSLVCPFWSQ